MRKVVKMGHLNYNEIISEKQCEQCGKTFTFTCPRGQYLYKKVFEGHLSYFCSDKCKREFEKQWVSHYNYVGAIPKNRRKDIKHD